MAEITTLRRKRGSIKSKLTNFKAFLANINSNLDNGTNIDEVQLRLNKSISILDSFDEVQTEIECVCDESELVKETGERFEFENEYYKVVALANSLLNSRTNTDSAASNDSCGSGGHNLIKLPTINLPKFSGEYSDWLEFKDTFKSLIHENNSISTIQKFHYLRASLGGNAAQVIKSIEFSEQNYHLAFDSLIKRYDSSQLLVYNHIKSIFELPSISKENSTGIRHIIDEFAKHLRSLDILQERAETFDAILIYVLSNKLDYKTAKEWQEKQGSQSKSLDEFNEYLKSKADTLESIESRLKRSEISNTKFQKQRSFAVTINSCNFCKQEHQIYKCNEFLKLTPKERVNKVKSLQLCFNCLRSGHRTDNCNSSSCRTCGLKHNSLLHYNKTNTLEENDKVTFSGSCLSQRQVILATAIVKVADKFGNYHKCVAMLDCGSQSHFITTRLCNKLGIKIQQANISLLGVNQVTSSITKKCEINMKSNINNFAKTLSCFVLNTITDRLGPYNMDQLDIPKNIELANPNYSEATDIDLLIGGALYWEILSDGKISLGKNTPFLQNSKLGWVVAGQLEIPDVSHVTTCNLAKIDIQRQLQQFWEIEEYPNVVLGPTETKCENYFEKTVARSNEGRFIVAIPFKQDPSILGDSRRAALRRFFALERKFRTQPQLKQMYQHFMNEYIQLGHMTLSNENNKSSYYLPHHGVLRENSLITKLRVVFDGSMPSDNNLSLNDIQYIGPNLQQNLINILIRFRQHNWVFTADVSKMYRQILVREEDRKYQKIFWRNSEHDQLSEYELNTVTYGTRSAPYLAIRCLKQIAKEHATSYPEASETINNDFYVDDLISGSEDIEHASQLTEDISKLLQSAGCDLQKWTTNNQEILRNIPKEKRIDHIQDFKSENCKTLGLQWSCQNDVLSYNITESSIYSVTKRSILSETSQVFDPLGLVAPVIIKLKILLQQLWSLKIAWDDEVPPNVLSEWTKIRSNLTCLNHLQIHRHILCQDPVSVELHGFCDSSKDAYGACIYAKSISSGGSVHVALVCAKAKVAPLKPITIPKLELCGALLLAKLMNQVIKSLTIQPRTFYWSDSQIVLAWLKSEPNMFHIFVSNRVAEIQNLTNISDWCYVNTKQNPADLLSRGVQPENLMNQRLWWLGPEWLYLNTNYNKNTKQIDLMDLPETKTISHAATTKTIEFNPLFLRYSKLSRLVKITALCLRFINNLRRNNNRRSGVITNIDRNEAITKLVTLAQWETFLSDINDLRKSNYSGKLRPLYPFLDDNNVLRVGGRIQNSKLDFEAKHPVLLSHIHPLSKLIIEQEHLRLQHAGLQQLSYSLRERFWITSSRSLIKRIIHNCLTCFKLKPRDAIPIMANLPHYRVQPSLPFSVTGTDFAGPYTLRESQGRKHRHFKCYICIFICMTTKAIHIEPVTNLSTESFLAAFRRFTSRRGIPSHMFSDNGTTFVKASKDLKELGNFLENNKDSIEDNIASLCIQWSFIPPYSPNFGGLWEAAVKSAKFHLKRMLLNQVLTLENFLTLLVCIEGVLNSRPLTPLSPDPLDFTPLTPAHFLIGRPITALPSSHQLSEVKINRLTTHQQIQHLHRTFWIRWSKEYITNLQVRWKWNTPTTSIKKDTLVLIKDVNLPPTRWKLGRVEELHPGKDGIVRAVTIRTSSGQTQRAVNRLCPLPMEEHN